MPKASKKAKDKKADFVKAKLKLGKGKKPANNATDTSFKARSVALPSQSPLARALARAEGDAPTEPTTAKGLALDDVLINLRHPNAGARREAVAGVQEVLQVGVAQGVPLGAREGETAKVVRAVGALVSDNETVVRKAVLGFFSWYIAALPTTALAPYLPLLLLQIASALSHIFPEVRIDACRLVALLLEHAPAAVVGAWPRSAAAKAGGAGGDSGGAAGAADGGATVFEGLRLAVGLGTDGPVAGFGAQAKLVVLRTVLAFIGHALDDGASSREAGIAAAAAPTYDWETLHAGLCRPGWLAQSGDLANGGGSSVQLGDLGHGLFQTESDKVEAYLTELYISLHPLFVSTFLESAPTAFSPSSTVAPSASRDVHVGLCSATAELECVLATAILSATGRAAPAPRASPVRAGASDFLRRLAAYFPFATTAPPGRTTDATPAVAPAFALCLAYAKTAVLLAPRPPAPVYAQPASWREPAWRAKARAIEAAWAGASRRGVGRGEDGWALRRVAEWAVDVLEPPSDALTPALPLQAYAALLPVIRALLLQPPRPGRAADADADADADVDVAAVVGEAFLAHLARQTGRARALGDRFVFALVEAHEDSHPAEALLVPPDSALRPPLRAWAEALPKTLWELGARDEQAAEEAARRLLALAALAAESPYALVTPPLLTAIAAKLAPYFHLVHPSRGALPGPWARLSRAGAARRLALDLACAYAPYAPALGDAVGRAIGGTPADDGARAYWAARRVAL